MYSSLLNTVKQTKVYFTTSTYRNMSSIIDGLKPELVWKHFEDITKIPSPSKHEERILKYLKNFANERSLEMREDSTGNIVVLRPGSSGGENAPIVIIQSHVDMVCEKN